MATSEVRQHNDLLLGIEWGLLRKLEGKSFCMTGKHSVTRDRMQNLVMALGGEVHDAVKTGTSYLVVPVDGGDYTSKYRVAMARGTKIITEEEFCEMIVPTVEELNAGGSNVGSGSGS